MSVATQRDRQPAAESPAPKAPRSRRNLSAEHATWAGAALLALAAIVGALVQPVFNYMPDEPLYEHMARALAHGDGFDWRGDPVTLNTALYVYLITPAWMLAGGETAYLLARLETAILCCLVAVPIWRLARSLLSPRLTALAVALTLSGTWMSNSGSLITENAAMPLATASLASMVHALRTRSSRWSWIALGLAVLATWARLQVVVLLPALVLALIIDIVRSGALWRDHLRLFRAPLAAAAGVALLCGGAVLLGGDAVVGGYEVIFHLHLDPGKAAADTGSQTLMLAAASGFLPLLLLAAIVWRRDAWRDAAVGPFLSVLAPAVAIFAVQSGYYLATGGFWPIQRYILYVVPLLLLFTLVVLRRPGLAQSRTFAFMAAAALALLATPTPRDPSEQRAVHATVERVGDLIPGVSAGVAALSVALVLCMVGAVVHRRGAGGGEGHMAWTLGLVVGFVLLAQTATAWQEQLSKLPQVRADLPADAAWVEHHSHGNVAVLEVTMNTPLYDLIEFFNDGISRYYVLSRPLPGFRLIGGSCDWRVAAKTGVLTFSRGCPPNTDEFFIYDPAAHLAFNNEISSADNPQLGRIVRVKGRPRLTSLIIAPCDRPVPHLAGQAIPCRPQLEAHLWLDRPGTVHLRFKGSPYGDHQATIGSVPFSIPAGKVTSIPVRAGTGAQDITMDLDWADNGPESPSLLGVDLQQGSDVRRLM